jgi:hypothetical protein
VHTPYRLHLCHHLMGTIINGKPLLARLQVCLIPPPYLTAARNGGDEIDNVGEFSTSNAAATGTGHTGVSTPDVPIELSLRSSNTWLKPSVPQDLALPGKRPPESLAPDTGDGARFRLINTIGRRAGSVAADACVCKGQAGP